MGNIEPASVIASIIILFLGIGLHEYAHCKFADMAGDPTPSFYGRVTLNLFKHFEPMGTLAMVISSMSGYGLGWGRPAPMDPRRMRNPRWDFFIAVIAGPISNLLQAVVYAAVIRILLAFSPATLLAAGTDPFFGTLLFDGVLINLTLCFFNLIPFGPLDGQWLLGLLMPEPMRIHWFQFNRRIGMIGLLAAIFIMQYFHFSPYAGPVMAMFRFLTGLPV